MSEHLLLARFAIAAGEDSAALFAGLPAGCEVTVRHRIQLGLLKSLQAVAMGAQDDALADLTATLRIAAHTGHRQRFLDERFTLGALLDNAAARAGVSLLPRAEVDAVVIDLGSGSQEAAHRAATRTAEAEPTSLIEPLTERELDVLRLLPSHLSYMDIGSELAISVNTVKYHIKAIYRKLDAENRADAVQRAQRSGLLPTRIQTRR